MSPQHCSRPRRAISFSEIRMAKVTAVIACPGGIPDTLTQDDQRTMPARKAKPRQKVVEKRPASAVHNSDASPQITSKKWMRPGLPRELKVSSSDEYCPTVTDDDDKPLETAGDAIVESEDDKPLSIYSSPKRAKRKLQPATPGDDWIEELGRSLT
ncbi:unnamed protein product, partial [Prorocentrum cordatum]